MKNFIVSLFLLCCICAFSQTKHEDGPYKEYYKDGQLKKEGYYKNDKKVNVWKEYYDNGQLSKIYVLDNNGKNTGLKRDYSKEGILLKETKQVLDGTLVTHEYYNDGSLLGVYGVMPIEGKDRFAWSGEYKEFYKRGALKIEATYVNNELNGVWKLFDESGDKTWEVEYLNGYKQGVYSHFYKNKHVKVLGFCNQDKKEGEEKQFDSVGNILNTLKYKKDQLKKVTDEMSLYQVIIPDGVVNRPAVYPGCERVLGYNAQKKCLVESVSNFVTSRFNTSKFQNLAGINERIKIKVFVTFRISETGEVNTVRAKSDYPEVDAEVVNLIRKLPKLKPALKRGVTYTVTFPFQYMFLAGGISN